MKTLMSFLVLLLIMSCAKLNDDELNNRIHYRSPFDPDDYHGMLWFDDMNHVQRYYHYLDTLLANPSVFDIDSMLDIIESNFDYTSLRQSIFVDPITDEDTGRANMICVPDELRQSIYNNHYSVRIGDSTYFKYSINQVYFMHVDSENLILNFQNAPNGGLEDTIPYSLLYDGVYLDSPVSQLEINSDPESVTNPPIVPRNPPFDLIAFSRNVKCDPFKEHFEARMKDPDDILEPFFRADYTIDFGDGNSDFRDYVDPFSIEHTYAVSGKYTATITAEFNYYDGSVTTTYNYMEKINVTIGEGEGNCTWPGEIQPPDKWVYNGSNGMRTKIWFVNDILGQHYGCRTTSYKKIGDDYKKRDASYVQAILDADWRSMFSCEIDGSVYEEESKTNARDARVSEKIEGHCNFNPLKLDYLNCIGMLNHDLQSDHWVTPKSGNPMSYSWDIIICQ